jgi:hypothetical protein
VTIRWEPVEDKHTGERAIRMPLSALKGAQSAKEYADGLWEIFFSMSTPGRFKFARNRLAWLKRFPDAKRLPGYGEAVKALWRARGYMRRANWTRTDLELAECRAGFEIAVGRAAIIKAQATRAVAGKKSGEARRQRRVEARALFESLIRDGASEPQAKSECLTRLGLNKRQLHDALKIQK